jgi:hypothetical protein
LKLGIWLLFFLLPCLVHNDFPGLIIFLIHNPYILYIDA